MSRRTAREVRAEDRRREVRARYGGIASEGGCCAGSGASSDCCGTGGGACSTGPASVATQLGYSARELSTLPEGANLGLGCGHPTALTGLRPGEVVLDLGSGAGVDCFLAAKKVGARGQVIGVDMTPEMVAKARANARNGHYANVEFRLGEIEHLPVADRSADVVLSNCVINLAPDKGPVYREAFRVLRPGGRLAVSDVVATRPISARDRSDPSRWSSCSAGALTVRAVQSLLSKAGFQDVQVELKVPDRVPDSLQGQASLGVVPADIRAVRPAE